MAMAVDLIQDPLTVDRRIAQVLLDNQERIIALLERPDGATLRAGKDSAKRKKVIVEALANAFQRGRWGTFYCQFDQPGDAARWLSQIASTLVPYLLNQPDPGELVSRLTKAVAEMTLVVTESERAGAERVIDELRELVELKTAFIRLTTHELRRPLGLTRGHISLLEEGTYGEVPEEIRHALQQILAGAHEMSNLVDGLAAVARIEDRAEVLRPVPCRVATLVSDAVRAVTPEASLKGVRLEQRLPRPDLQIPADKERLRIAVLNLLTNAIKYAPANSTVSVHTAERPREVAIVVADQGPGIDAVDGEQVFEKHYRSSRDISRLPGLGLGLYIVRQIAELHRGRVTMSSVPGEGSTFAIVVPIESS